MSFAHLAVLLVAAVMLVVLGVYAGAAAYRMTVGTELRRNAAIVASSSDAIISTNGEGLIRSWNRGAERLYGYSAAEALGKHFSMLYPDPSSAAELVRQIEQGLEVQDVETTRRRKDGTLVDVSLSVSLVKDKRGRTIAISAIVRDIRQRKQAERAMRDAREIAESANRAKSEFLANMSHEIRTPMNGVHGMLDLALETSLRAEQRELLETAKSSADLLLRIINDILDVSKIEAGRLELEATAFDLRDVVGIAMRPLGLRASDKGLRFAIDIDDELPQTVRGDSGRFRQILINLVGNAVKFTEAGEVVVSVAADPLRAVTDATVPVIISVRDTGIGIAPAKQPAVFSAFVQEDASTTRRYGGTGLGLAIAAQLSALMGGRIWVESEAGSGSTFYCALTFGRAAPVALVAPAASTLLAPSEQPPTRPLRILLAEDNTVNQTILTTMLERRGHSITLAHNGREAVAEFQLGMFDLILMDVQMPELGGFEATQLIRAQEEGSGTRIPIIAVTAHAMSGDRERCLSAGMDDYVSKPVSRAVLFDTLGRWASPMRPVASMSAGPVPTNSPGAIDEQALLGLVDGDRELLAELIALYMTDVPRLIAKCRTAVTSSDARGLFQAAHAITGSAASMTAAPTAAAARDLERLAETGSLPEASAALLALEHEFSRSESAFGSLNQVTL